MKKPYGSVAPRAATRWLRSSVTVTSAAPMGAFTGSRTSTTTAPAPAGTGEREARGASGGQSWIAAPEQSEGHGVHLSVFVSAFVSDYVWDFIRDYVSDDVSGLRRDVDAVPVWAARSRSSTPSAVIFRGLGYG